MSLHLIEPDLGRISGGAAFNRALAEAAGPLIVLHSVPGCWNSPGSAETAAVRDLLATVTGPVLLDGLIATALPELMTDSRVGNSSSLTSMSSPPPADTTGTGTVVPLLHCLADSEDSAGLDRERQAVSAAPAVIATSRFTAAEVGARYGIRAETALPGNPARPQSAGEGGGHFVCIGAIGENKGQLLIAEALAAMPTEEKGTGTSDGPEGSAQQGRPWRVTFAGPLADPACSRRLHTICRSLPAGSADIVGELTTAEIDTLYQQADLLLLPSRSEAYGLVVAEAAAAGIPAFVTAGTGAEEPLSAGLTVPRTVDAWAQALHRWLADDEFRFELTEAARQSRPNAVRAWTETAATVQRVMDEHSPPGPPCEPGRHGAASATDPARGTHP